MEILSLGEKIKRKRKELNMTLKDLAGDRITPGQISLVESGKSNPSMDLLEYLAGTLNTSVEYLMESEETQAQKICTYYENISEAYILNDDLVNGEQNIEKAMYYADKYNLEYRKAKNLYLRGIINMSKGEVGLAQQSLLAANVIFIKHSSYEDIINTFLKLGIITLQLKAYHSSFSYFQQAEKAFLDNEIGNDFLLGQIYYYIAYTYFKLERIDKAKTYSTLAREKFIQIEDRREYALSLLDMSQEFSSKSDVKNALKYAKNTISVFKEINDNVLIGEMENNLGKIFNEFDNLKESFLHLIKARELREKNKDPKLVDTLICICENHIKQKDIRASQKTLQDILDSIGNGDNKTLIEYYLLKYRVDILEGNIREGEKTLLMALNFVKNMDYLQETAELSILIGKFYIDYGRSKEAAGYLEQGVDIFKKLGMIKDF